MKSYSFLFWGTNVVWLGIAAYVGYLFVRVRAVDVRLERLERRLSGGERELSAGDS